MMGVWTTTHVAVLAFHWLEPLSQFLTTKTPGSLQLSPTKHSTVALKRDMSITQRYHLLRQPRRKSDLPYREPSHSPSAS